MTSTASGSMARHPLEGPLSFGDDDGDQQGHHRIDHNDDDVPASYHAQSTIRSGGGNGTLRPAKGSSSSSAQARPSYFDLQRLAAQSDLLGVQGTDPLSTSTADTTHATGKVRRVSRPRTSRRPSVLSTADSTHTRSEREAGEGDEDVKSIVSASGTEHEDEDELPAWIHRVRQRSPVPTTFQPRPITQVLDFTTHVHSDTVATPSASMEGSEADFSNRSGDITAILHGQGDEADAEEMEQRLAKALTEVERWRKAYEEVIARHAREVKALKRTQAAREAALLEIVTSSGISKARAERALTHATTQAQVPVLVADQRMAEGITRARSPLPILNSTSATIAQGRSPARSISSGEEQGLPASLMEAMLDEFHSDLSTPVTQQSERMERAMSIGGKSMASRPASPTPSNRSSYGRLAMPGQGTGAEAMGQMVQPSAPSSAPSGVTSTSGSSSGGGSSFFTLNWRRKKSVAPLVNAPSKVQDRISSAMDAKVASPIAANSPSNATATLNKALDKNRRRSRRREPNVTRLPSFFGPSSSDAVPDAQATTAPTSITQELEPILAHDVRPPTLTMAARRRGNSIRPQPFDKLQRQRTIRQSDGSVKGAAVQSDEYQSSGDEFEVYGGKHLSPEELAQRVSSTIQQQRKAGEEDNLLTDQYGFVYDATPADVRLLRRARKEASHAPACLTGIRVGVRARGGTDSQSEGEKEEGNALASDVSDDEAVATSNLDSPTAQLSPPNPAKVEAEMRSTLATSMLPTPEGMRSDPLAGFAPDPHPSPSPNVGGRGLLDVPSSKPVVEASSLTAASLSPSQSGPTSPEEERAHFLGKEGQSTAEGATQHPGNGVARHKRKANTSQTVRRLLGQLQEMHNRRQDQKQIEWDAFFDKRRATLREQTEQSSLAHAAGVGQSSTGSVVDRKGETSGDVSDLVSAFVSSSVPGKTIDSNGAPLRAKSTVVVEEQWSVGGLLGLGQMGSGTRHQQEFRHLIQGGIPLVYRPKIWYECSGAMDRVEPGRYQELLEQHGDEENACTRQIDLDVGRTMPTNIFFAGDGPGVGKLRRVLVAYSWYNPRCGYCQGMNNLAATLLLTHAEEEQAFWVLASIVENLLPPDYFTSHLLTAQADQRVLLDFVQDRLPKLARHITTLGVDLPAVTFAWFLSLFTDCLPVETLFRVWDVLLVEGMVTVFRVAMAILTLNEADLRRTDSPSSFYSLMHGMTSHQFSADRLLAMVCADEMAQVVRLDRIEARRARHTQDLVAELGLDSQSLHTVEDSTGQRTPSASSIKL